MELRCTLAENNDKSLLRIALHGGLNSDTVADFKDTMDNAIAADWQMIVLDMQALDYISSAGLRVIFKSAKELKAAKRTLAVANRQPQIEKVFEILQALPDMAVFANDDELDDYLDVMQARVLDD